jgi:hypothetical protein
VFANASLAAVNCTFVRNQAESGVSAGSLSENAYGGAIATLDANVAIAFSTIVSNVVNGVGGGNSFGGGIYSAGTNTSIASSLLASNLAMQPGPLWASENVNGTIQDSGNNLSSDNSAAFTASGSLNNIDPLLGPLSDNGGFTWTIPLLDGSPAIDAGNPANAPATDQRGITRPQGLGPDIGAYER